MAERRAFVRNAGDAKQVKRATESSARKAAREAEEWRELLSATAGGRRLWWILEECGIHKLSFDTGVPSDALRTAFNEGARNMGNKILAKVFEADPDAYLRMQKDAAKLEEGILEPPARTEDPLEVDEDDGN